MLPYFVAFIVDAYKRAFDFLFNGPSQENTTVSIIKYRLAYEESHREMERQESERRKRESEVQRETERQENERRVRALEEERKGLQVMEMDRRRRGIECQRVQADTEVRGEEESRQGEEDTRRAEETRRINEEGRQRWEEERQRREADEKVKKEEERRQGAEEREKREEETRRREEERQRREADEKDKKEEESRQGAEEREKREEETRRREEERQRREADEKDKKEEESRQGAEEREKREEETRRREEERQERRKRVKEERRKNEEEKRELARRMQELERREKNQEEAIEKLKKEHAAQIEAERVGGPLRWPTREEFHETMKRTQYDSNLFHFAIVGRAGSGKSSLINAFRNLRNKEGGAAPTGTAETTLDIERYPDPGSGPPRQWIVWFDVPGVGTQRIPHQDYFVKQGLYVFDLIILAIGDRFEEIDARIIEDCKRFQVPTFIVRSKADMHILNSMKEYGDYTWSTDDPEKYRTCRESFITQSQKTVSDGLMRQNLPDQPVYIVSRNVLQRTYNSALQNRGSAQLQQDQEVIHERHLVNALLEAAAERRCETKERSKAQGVLGSARASLGGLFGETGGAPAPAPAPAPARGVPRRSTRVELASTTRNQPQQDSITAVVNPTLIEKIKKVIHPRKPTDADQLYTEMLSHSPELRNMLMEKPRMFTPTIALLTFYPMALIPNEIKAFGGVLRVKEYQEREKRGSGGRGGKGGKGGREGRGERGKGATVRGQGGHVPTAVAESTGSEGNNGNTPSETTRRRGRMRQERDR